MSRQLIVALLVASAPAYAEPADEIGDQGVAAAIGVTSGGRVTPGGLRVTGHYLYQLSATDWFDGIAAFTAGGGDPGCFRDRDGETVCDHGVADGAGFEIAAGVRRMFASQGKFRPFVRAAIGVSYVRYSDDDLSGVAFPLHLGGGVRARVSDVVAIVGLADLAVGFARFGRGLGSEPHLGLAITAGVEFRLK